MASISNKSIINKAQELGINPYAGPYGVRKGQAESEKEKAYVGNIAAQLGVDPNNTDEIAEALGLESEEDDGLDDVLIEDEQLTGPEEEQEEIEQEETEQESDESAEESQNEEQSSGNEESAGNQKKSQEQQRENEQNRPQQQNRHRANQNNQNNNGLNNKYRKNQQNPSNPNKPGAKKPGANSAGKGAKDAAKTAGKSNAAKQGLKEGAKNAKTALKEGFKKLAKDPRFWIILGIVLFVVFVVIFICVSVANNDQEKNTDLQDQVPYVKVKHNNTVKVKIDGKIETISLDEYVAGVLYHEISGFKDSPETLKAFAIAARTNVLILMRYEPYAKTYKSDGYLKNSNMLSYKKVSKNSKFMKAAEETTGMVLVTSTKNPKLYWAFFDAIAFKKSCGGKETDTSVFLCQKQVEIPIKWLKKHGNWSRIQYQSAHKSHGKGMSQWGAYYLAKEKKKTALELLKLFYSDAKVVTFIPNSSTENKGADSDPNKDINVNCNNISFKSTPGYSKLTTNIKSFYSNKGASLKSVNNNLRDTVISAGPGTRCAVVTAAKYSVEVLSKFKAKLPYFWGGTHSYTYGFHKSWGSKGYAKNKYGTEYYRTGLDCGTFVMWAFRNGGVKISFTQFKHRGSHHSVGSYIGKPGDVLYGDGHVMLILQYKKNRRAYYVAEAGGKKAGVQIRLAYVSKLKKRKYHVVDMSYYYKHKAQSESSYKKSFSNKRSD